MRIPPWLYVLGALVLALPFGWGLGLLLAYAGSGRNIGQPPALTIPIALVGSIAFALWREVTPQMRLAVMGGGTAMFLVLGALAG
jgi:hypothetical protein